MQVALSALADGHCEVRADSREILVIETEEGLRVWNGVCPHLGGPLLDGRISRRKVVCPWHHYVFDAATGQCRTVPGRMWRTENDAGAGEPMSIALHPLRFSVDGNVVQVDGE